MNQHVAGAILPRSLSQEALPNHPMVFLFQTAVRTITDAPPQQSSLRSGLDEREMKTLGPPLGRARSHLLGPHQGGSTRVSWDLIRVEAPQISCLMRSPNIGISKGIW